jgi:hypothetical protein
MSNNLEPWQSKTSRSKEKMEGLKKVGRGEKGFFFTFHWPLSNGTFHWPPSLGSTFTPLLLLFKRRTWIIGGLFFPNIIFNSVLNTCFDKLLEEEYND